MSDHKGAALLLPILPPAREPLGERGYDNRFRAALAARGIVPCIPSTRSRKVPIPHDTILYRQRHRVEAYEEWRNDIENPPTAYRDTHCWTFFRRASSLFLMILRTWGL